MKKLLLSALIFSLTSTVWAVTYDVALKLTSNGTVLNQGRVVVNEGEEATLENDKNFIELVAVPHTKGIALTVVSGITAVDGSRTVVSNAELIVANGKTATMTVGKLTTPSETIQLTITPKIVPATRKN